MWAQSRLFVPKKNLLLKMLLCLCFCVFIFPTGLGDNEEDYYELLGVEKNADLREIRKAFKTLAVQKHPDKNKGDPEAHANFVKLAEAYDVLKDPTKRNEYDMFGKRDSQAKTSTRYHSYSYYRDQFGIYDDDPLIVTLTRDDFKSSIGDNIWFINFYSPLCSHCHHLAPEWRKLSELLEGVVKIGAVNCEDERNLCWEIPIPQFPTLLFYDEKATIHDGKEYHGGRVAENMEKFIMSHISSVVDIPILNTLPTALDGPWLLFLCFLGDCPSHFTSIKLACVLKGIARVAYIDNKDVLDGVLSAHDEQIDIMLWRHDKDKYNIQPLRPGDYNELAEKVLTSLPEAPKLDELDFQNVRKELRMKSSNPWLLCFTLAADTHRALTLKKLTGLLNGFNVGEVDCAKNSELCATLHIVKYPTWGILKIGGAFELHTGQSSLLAIERFALDANEATNIHALSPLDIQRLRAEGTPWMIGWMLTGCPPCKRLLPALRKASNHFSPDVIQFGTVDCTVHSFACSSNNVNSFPTATLYNVSSIVTFHGEFSEKAIVEFIQTMKSNYVVSLTKENFYDEVFSKDGEIEAYVVKFYAPWCAPCQRLQPEWIKLAQKLSDLKKIKIGAVNCDTDYVICEQQAVKAYPTLRYYPINHATSESQLSFFQYAGASRDYASIRKWILSYLPSPIKILNSQSFRDNLLSNDEHRTWVILFFAPWCGYCHQFEPEFFIAVQRLQSSVVAGKVDCQKDGALCQSEQILSYPTVKLYQRIDGVTKFSGGITLDAYTQEALFAEMRAYAANAYITPINHDEL